MKTKLTYIWECFKPDGECVFFPCRTLAEADRMPDQFEAQGFDRATLWTDEFEAEEIDSWESA